MTDASPTQNPYAEGLALLKKRNHLSEAEAAFRAGLQADPDHIECLLNLGITLRAQGRWREAFATLIRARSLSPETPDIPMEVGKVLRLQKKMDAALDAYDAALTLDPDHVNTRIHRAFALQEMNRWEDALSSYDSLIAELTPEMSATNGLPKRQAEVKACLELMIEFGIDAALSQQKMAVALYRRANQRVLEGALDDAVRLYEGSALLAADYSDPEFPIGETVAAQLSRRPSGEFSSCHWLEEGLHFHEYKLGFCCTAHSGNKGWATVGTYHGGPVPIDFVLARRNQLITQNQAGVDNACRGCHELEHRAWPIKPQVLGALIINSYSVCNMKCSYCSLAIANFEMSAYYYMAEPAIDSLIANGWLDPHAAISWGGGEPCVSREFTAISTKLLATGCHFYVNTNATRVLSIIEEALRQGRCDVIISIDSGTPDTFYRVKFRSEHPVMIKGRPAFDLVWANIAQYVRASSGSVLVKYIFTTETSGEADVDGFVELCLRHGVTRVMLTPEFGDVSGGEVPPIVWQAINQARALAQARGLSVQFNPLDPSTGNMPADLQKPQPIPA